MRAAVLLHVVDPSTTSKALQQHLVHKSWGYLDTIYVVLRGSSWTFRDGCGSHAPCHQRSVCECARVRGLWDHPKVARPFAWVLEHPDLTSCCCVPASQFTTLGPEWVSYEEATFWTAKALVVAQLSPSCPESECQERVQLYMAAFAQRAGVTESSILACAAGDQDLSLRTGKPEGKWRRPRGDEAAVPRASLANPLARELCKPA